NPGLPIRPEHLAYVIYTSGSTGQPKGVLVEHRNVVQLLYSHNPEYDFSASDAWLLFHSVCFDFSVWEMYGALLFGGKLVVPTAETVKDPAQCWQLVTREKITVFNQTPSAFYHFAREAEQQQWPAHHIRYVIFGGEALQPAQLANWFNHYPQTRLVNMFGITETTVHVTYKEITLAEITRGTSNIGRPLSTLYVYILDEHRQLLPAGIAGELYIGGAGLARGYLNREQLTAARFIPDPFKPGNRLYRSGDKARLTANGDLEYLGRADEQVKIRGYRIEPGEIETVLESHAQVKKAIVLAVTNSTGDSELVAFVTGCNETECEALRHYLGSRLPAYMLPAQIIALAYIPVTVNGKADKKALLQLKQSAAAQHTRFEPPLPGWENELALLWNKVLGVEPGRNDHFFHRGGHSLSAIQLQLLIKQQWNIAFNVAEIFMHPELAPLAERVRDAVHNQQPVTGTAIPQLGVQEAYAASPAQKRMWFLEQFQTGAYNVEIALRITGSPNMEKLGTALFQLVQRHEILRTVFRHSTDVEQCILPGFAPEQIFQTEHTGITTSIEDVLGQRIARPFSLEEGPLFRATLFTRHEQEHILLLEIHHIIFDDWSAPILVTELLHFYNGNAEPLPALPVQYKEYAAWKLAERNSTAYTNAASFWKNRFAELPEPLELPLDFPRPRHKTYNGTTCTHRLNEHETSAIRRLCRQTGATFSQVGLALFKLLLYRYTGQYDLVTGMPIFERDHPQFEQLIGLFQNTLAVRIKLNPEYTLTEWIQEVSRETVQCYNHRIFPFDDLVEQLHLPRNLSRSPLFDVLYTHQLAGSYLTGADAGATISRVPLQPPVSPFDIVFSVVEAEHETQFSITANTDLFGVPKIERMLPHLLHLLQEMIAHPAKQVKQTACIGLPEWEQFPFRGENTHGITPIQQLWLQQLEQRPEQTALVYNGHSYSYREVFDTALAIAGALQQRGCRAEHRVGVYCTEKSHHAFVFAALLLMNACYLPIDMKLPEARRRFILEEARPYLLVTDDITTGTSGAVNEVSIHELLTGTAAQIPPVFFTGKEEAFIIYTSGTTGMPKGMMQTCSTISNLCTWMVKDINTRAGESFLQFAAVSFDAFVSDMAFAWAAGLTACIAHETERQDFNLLYRLLTEHRISVASLPYSVLRSFIAVTPVEELNALLWQRIVTYGEQLIVSEKFAAYLQAHPHIGLLNYYGPAETHVVTAYTHSGSTPAETYQPIGRPVANNEVYVLDNDGQPVPTGVTGLLYARGANVFNGYINSTLPSRKTRFAHIAGGEILFNTGDLARWQENGQLRYMGRRDQQIKINGNRVEIAEIEQCLLRCTGVQQAVVIPEKEHNGQLRLLGFYSGATTLLPAVLQQHLQQYLPVYMIPALLLPVPEFPVNKNGKIDKPALLAMVPQTTTGNGVAETFTPLQEALKTLWEEVLQQPVHTQQGDFFALGGHSLSASLLLNRIRETFRCKINIEHIFEYPQLGQMAAYIETAETAWYAPLPVQPAAGAFPLSPAQLGFWLKIQANPGSEAHHISAGFRVKEQPDVQVLEQAVQLLVNRHAALRTVFRIMNGHVQQVVLPETETRFRLLQQNGAVENVYAADVATWPLFQLQLNGTTTSAPLLFIAIHHMVCDGWSLEIFVQELAEIYTAIQKGNHAVLNPVKQYPDYAMWINRQPLAAAEAYWRQQLPFCTLQNNLRSYRQTEQVQDMAGSNVEFVLPVTENLRAFLQAQQLTAYHYVLAVMFTLLHRSGLEKNLLLAGVSAGRIHKDLEPMLGYFLNTYYLCVQVNAGNTFPAFCAQVKQQARAALQHQLLPFEKILEFLGEEKRLPTHRALHETGLTYQKSRYGLPVARAEENGINIIPEPAAVQQVKDPLWWYFTDSGTALRVDVHFATNVYTRTAIETLTRLYTELFNGLYNGNQLVTDTATQSHAQLTAAALQNLDEDF
ncbi:MAG: amino acid adenylation domain-containing protein, partial [Dinghuibacter sp.]|nr:amino acid adenylation domain-containing protein [Dinghuibacter sp.]